MHNGFQYRPSRGRLYLFQTDCLKLGTQQAFFDILDHFRLANLLLVFRFSFVFHFENMFFNCNEARMPNNFSARISFNIFKYSL